MTDLEDFKHCLMKRKPKDIVYVLHNSPFIAGFAPIIPAYQNMEVSGYD